MQDLRRLSALCEVGRLGSFSAAARELSLTQSAVSQQIALLERQTGLTLVHRAPGAVRLTAAGEVLAARASDALAHLAAADVELASFRGLASGQVRICAFASAAAELVPRAAALFAERHPGPRLTLGEGEPVDALRELKAGRVEVAVVFDYRLEAPATRPDAVVLRPLLDEPVLVALPAGHALAAHDRLPLGALSEAPWIEAGCAGVALPVLARLAGGGEFAPRVHYTGDDFGTVLGLVAAGLGVALVPQLACRRLPDGVALRPLGPERLRRTVSAATLATRFPAPAVAAMLDALAEAAAARPARSHYQRY